MHCNVAGLIEEKVINMRNMMMDDLIIDHKFTIPAVRCLVHQQRFTIERKDLDRYCLRPELEIGSGRNPSSNAQ